MESVAYVISKSFIIVAADTNFEFDNGELRAEDKLIKKVYRLNDRLVITVLGTIQKVSDIITYMLKLSELGGNETYEEASENLKSLFNTTRADGEKAIKKLMSMDFAKDDKGHIRPDEIMKMIADDANMQILFRDALDLATAKAKAPTSVVLIGVDEDNGVRVDQHLTVGHYLTEGSSIFAERDGISVGFASSTLKESQLVPTAETVRRALVPLLTDEDWENDREQTAAVISMAKLKLVEALSEISPYRKKPSVVFYELSPFTKNVFLEPDLPLRPILLNNR